MQAQKMLVQARSVREAAGCAAKNGGPLSGRLSRRVRSQGAAFAARERFVASGC